MVDRCRGYLRILLLDDVEHEVEEGAENLAIALIQIVGQITKI